MALRIYRVSGVFEEFRDCAQDFASSHLVQMDLVWFSGAWVPRAYIVVMRIYPYARTNLASRFGSSHILRQFGDRFLRRPKKISEASAVSRTDKKSLNHTLAFLSESEG